MAPGAQPDSYAHCITSCVANAWWDIYYTASAHCRAHLNAEMNASEAF